MTRLTAGEDGSKMMNNENAIMALPFGEIYQIYYTIDFVGTEKQVAYAKSILEGNLEAAAKKVYMMVSNGKLSAEKALELAQSALTFSGKKMDAKTFLDTKSVDKAIAAI